MIDEEFLKDHGVEIREERVFVDGQGTFPCKKFYFKGVEIDLTAYQQIGIEPGTQTDLEILMECIGNSFVKEFKKKIEEIQC